MLDISIAYHVLHGMFLVTPYIGIQWSDEHSQLDFGWLFIGLVFAVEWGEDIEGEDE